MSGHRKFSELRDEVLARPGALISSPRLAATLERSVLHGTQAVSQAELAGRLDIQKAVSKLRARRRRSGVDASQYLGRSAHASNSSRVRRRRPAGADPPDETRRLISRSPYDQSHDLDHWFVCLWISGPPRVQWTRQALGRTGGDRLFSASGRASRLVDALEKLSSGRWPA
jgi:hypothetical protein